MGQTKTEIEKKYLVDQRRWNRIKKRLDPPMHIKQGYLNRWGDAIVRVRWIDHGDGHFSGWITVKSSTSDLVREEREQMVPMSIAANLLYLCGTNVIEKYRYTYLKGSKKWEIDEFEGKNKGLVLAEIELTNIKERVRKPSWVTKEVTSDKKYYNVNLV